MAARPGWRRQRGSMPDRLQLWGHQRPARSRRPSHRHRAMDLGVV